MSVNIPLPPAYGGENSYFAYAFGLYLPVIFLRFLRTIFLSTSFI
jgi:hypothetical protein